MTALSVPGGAVALCGRSDDLAVDEVDTEAEDTQEICVGPPDFMILIGVHFPHADLLAGLQRG